ncbi:MULTISPECIES: hypothetical protein [Nocardia]|uniref:Uncharacterized protein n=2 Tax=Nocardia TaxID=1817 RepID=A0A4R6PK77_NOCIG|nr:hypothetical protein [Nocardia ignorata]MBC7302092.1 hypothetical protein [Nocardia sp.]TDP38557.1 hypothetical protein DFR75_103214 [Nocardia ignorata]
MPDPLVSPDRKTPESVTMTARYLEAVLEQAQTAANATSYIDIDQHGALVRISPDDGSAEAVARADNALTHYLREHRGVLGTDPRWRAHYDDFDRADSPRAQMDAGVQRDSLAEGRSRHRGDHESTARRHARHVEQLIADSARGGDAHAVARGSFAFRAAPVTAAGASAAVPRRSR